MTMTILTTSAAFLLSSSTPISASSRLSCCWRIRPSSLIIFDGYYPALSRLRSCGGKMNSTPDSESDTVGGDAVQPGEVLVQYIVLRRDLIDSWPLGSVVTQGCHASVAAIWSHKEDSVTLDYCSPHNLDSMHKVTLEVKGETQLLNLSEKLKAGEIAHKLWMEQPENIPTCIATKPYPKPVVSTFFKKLKLCK